MTAKEYLSQIKLLSIKIKQRERELAELEGDMYGISAVDTTKERVSGGKSVDITDCIDKKNELIKDIKRKNNEAMYLKDKIIGEIQELENTNYKPENKALFMNILFYRYVQDKRLEEIAVLLNYSYIHIKRTHGKALRAFEQKVMLTKGKDDTQ